MSELKNVPELRFSEFVSNLKAIKLGRVSYKVGSGSTPRGGAAVYSSEGIPFIRSQNVNYDRLITQDLTFITEEIHSSMSGSIVKPNDILLNITGASIGRSCVVPNDFTEGNVNQHVCIIRLKEEHDSKFYQLFLSSYQGQKAIQTNQAGGGREGLNFQGVRDIKVNVPALEEQQKIADFLSSVDKKIEQLTEKHRLLTEYKKGVMQQIFSQKIRFKDNNGNDYPEWGTKRFGEVFTRITRKNKEDNRNVMTISAQQGLINQEEYFNKSVAASDVTGYYLLKKGDFAYNKSYSAGYPMGAIKRLNRYEKGVVSTLYICFEIKVSDSPEFFEHYFEAGVLNHEIKKIAQEGARNHGLLNISVVEFFKDIQIELPCVEEQQKIANFLTEIDQKIDQAWSTLEQTKAFKKGLLQKMFV